MTDILSNKELITLLCAVVALVIFSSIAKHYDDNDDNNPSLT
jgi:hypothetical protein